MNSLIGKSVNSSGIIAPVTAFVKHHAANVIEKKINLEQKITKKISPPADRSLSASSSINLDKEFEARHPCHE